MTELLAFFSTPAGIATIAAIAHALPYIGVKLPIIHSLLTALGNVLGATPTTPALPGAAGSSPATPAPAASTASAKMGFLLNIVQRLMTHPSPAAQAAAAPVLAVAQAQLQADHPGVLPTVAPAATMAA